MGMFDYLRCDYPLPVEGANEREFQTKDTPRQLLDNYWIDESGDLWHEDYDIEDQSDPDAEGLERLFNTMVPVNKRWVKCSFSGEICFYDFHDEGNGDGGWMEFCATFGEGKLVDMEMVVNRQPVAFDDYFSGGKK